MASVTSYTVSELTAFKKKKSPPSRVFTFSNGGSAPRLTKWTEEEKVTCTQRLLHKQVVLQKQCHGAD